jgi:cytochrome c-type biogenesis protein CcmH/NrfF
MWPQLELGESRVWAGARGTAAVAASIIFGIMLAATPLAHAQGKAVNPMEPSNVPNVMTTEERSLFGSLRCMCGCAANDDNLLSTCPCTQAAEMRERLRIKMRAGETRDQIVSEYVADHGTAALVVPPNMGFMRAIFLVPVVVIGLGAYGLARLVRGWRRNPGGPPAPATPGGKGGDAYDARLDDELTELDD